MTGYSTILGEVPGGRELVEWFGRVPRFHDAELLDLVLVSKGESVMRVHAFNITSQVDSCGYCILDRHAIVTFHLQKVTNVSLEYFHPGIIFDLRVTGIEGDYQLTWDDVRQSGGTLSAEGIRVTLQPGTES